MPGRGAVPATMLSSLGSGVKCPRAEAFAASRPGGGVTVACWHEICDPEPRDEVAAAEAVGTRGWAYVLAEVMSAL